MKHIIFCVLIAAVACTCRQTIDTSRAVPSQQIFLPSPVTLIETQMPEKEKKSMTKTMANDTRCSIYDSICQKNFFQAIAEEYAHIGIPEIGIPVLDPFKLTNVTLSILGLLDLTLIEGVAEGIGKCIVTEFVTNVDARYREPHIMCNEIVIKGSYKLSSAYLASIMGGACEWCNVHGEGNFKIVLENWFWSVRYPFRIVKQTNGIIYLVGLFDKAKYQTNEEKVTLEADSVIVGNHDITQHVVSFINHHWKLIMHSDVGKFINDQSAQYYYDIYSTFFDKTPANEYLKDDLSLLIDN